MKVEKKNNVDKIVCTACKNRDDAVYFFKVELFKNGVCQKTLLEMDVKSLKENYPSGQPDDWLVDGFFEEVKEKVNFTNEREADAYPENLEVIQNIADDFDEWCEDAEYSYLKALCS